MQIFATTTVPAHRLRWLAGTTLILILGVVFVPLRGWGQQPAVLTPVTPIPTTPATVPTPSLTIPLPGNKLPGGADAKSVRRNHDDEANIPELSLGECIAIAIERQPALKAVRASQQGTAGGQQALNNIGRLGNLLSPDLPIRKEQANRGVIAAAADVQKVHNEVVQDVTRLYYTVVYAGQQEQLASDVVELLTLLVSIGEKLLDSKNPKDMTPQKLSAMKIGLAEARQLQATARQGQKSANAALREVMAVDDKTFPFRVKDHELPIMAQSKELTKDMVVAMALAYRPELALAAAGVDAFRLEVYAQGKVPFRRSVPTLASGADIHARDIPQAMRGKEYRPGAIVPEMPPQLVGSKYDRVCRAMAYSQRADAVYEKTRNLVSLEAETGYYDFELAAEKQLHGKMKYDEGKKLMDWVKANVDNDKVPKDILITSYAMAAKAQADYVESVFQYLVALAALERITAGGVKPSFPGR